MIVQRYYQQLQLRSIHGCKVSSLMQSIKKIALFMQRCKSLLAHVFLISPVEFTGLSFCPCGGVVVSSPHVYCSASGDICFDIAQVLVGDALHPPSPLHVAGSWHARRDGFSMFICVCSINFVHICFPPPSSLLFVQRGFVVGGVC